MMEDIVKYWLVPVLITYLVVSFFPSISLTALMGKGKQA
jgi:hypothetical protein